MYKRITKRNLLILCATFFVFISGYATRGLTGSGLLPAPRPDTTCISNLTFINPEPGCEIYETKLQKMTVLEDALNAKVSGFIKAGTADRIAVFARDLQSQRFVAINDNELFNMASLLKVPLAITYYRVADTAPDTLNEKITYTGEPNLYTEQAIEPPNKLVKGSDYAFKDLVLRALVYSDNTAAQILLEHISNGYFDKVLAAIGLQPVQNGAKNDLVSARSFASIFRVLYNSSFLSRESSNTILKTLTQSTFVDGAAKKIPKDVVVAHKFGERSIVNTNTGQISSRQLHDCGIVYANGGTDPYTFCIMTEGTDFGQLETVIQDISLTIYDSLKD